MNFLTLGDMLAYVAHQRKAINQERSGLVGDASQLAGMVRGAYQFATPGSPEAETYANAVLKDTQAIDTALQTIDLHLRNLAAKARMAATAVADAEARRRHAAASYRI